MHIVLADDHALFRDAICTWLEQLDDGVVISPLERLEDVLTLLTTDCSVDLVLLDLHMPGMRGPDDIHRVRALSNGIPLVIVSAEDDEHVISACLAAGANAYVPKSASGDELLCSLHRILPGLGNETGESPLAELSEKQRKILTLLGEGASNRAIAERLSLTEGTVKQYVSEILRVLDVDNRTQAGILARDLRGRRGSA